MSTKLSPAELSRIAAFLKSKTPYAGFRNPFFVSYYEGAEKQCADWPTADAMLAALEKFPKQPACEYGVVTTNGGDGDTMLLR